MLQRLGLGFLIGLWSTAALAFPNNTRYGYANCSSCHVSPTGGGILNSYGRMSSEELLSTWASSHESEPVHGALHTYLPEGDRIRLGGDVRYLTIQDKKKRNSFWMQRETELAMVPVPGLTLVGSVGLYAQSLEGDYNSQFRRHYALVDVNEHLSLRLGKFYPAYGILMDDHTIPTRQGLGWDEGEESYNLEVALKSQYGELLLTPMLRQQTDVSLDQTQGYRFKTDAVGGTARVAYYLGKTSQLGWSGLYEQSIDKTKPPVHHTAHGPFAIVGITPQLYLLSEADFQEGTDIPLSVGLYRFMGTIIPTTYVYSQVGYEVYKGIHFQAQYGRRIDNNEYGLRLQWFPRPHFETTIAGLRTVFGNTGLFLFHYYL